MLNRMMNEIKASYGHRFSVVDADVFAELVIQGAKTTIKAYDVVGLGRVSLAEMTQLFGLVKMQTLIIHPIHKDMPIYILERRQAKGRDVYRVDLIDTQMQAVDLGKMTEVLEKYTALTDGTYKPRFYDEMMLEGSMFKDVKKKDSADIDALAWEHLQCYLKIAETARGTKSSEKKKKSSLFVEDLIKESAISLVDVFAVNYGYPLTEKLCKKVLFGIN